MISQQKDILWLLFVIRRRYTLANELQEKIALLLVQCVIKNKLNVQIHFHWIQNEVISIDENKLSFLQSVNSFCI